MDLSLVEQEAVLIKQSCSFLPLLQLVAMLKKIVKMNGAREFSDGKYLMFRFKVKKHQKTS